MRVCSLWLVDYEFSDTILLITKTKVVFGVSAKKRKYSLAGTYFPTNRNLRMV